MSQPQTWDGIAACAELPPVVVDFLLVLAAHLEGNRLAEFEDRAAVQGGERAAVEIELDQHDGARRTAVMLASGWHPTPDRQQAYFGIGRIIETLRRYST